jgi:hypothetical protein
MVPNFKFMDTLNTSLPRLPGAAEERRNEPTVAGNGEKLVDAKTLLALLWDEASRPSLRWLREQQARRTIPYIKLGARVWFQPSEVQRHLQQKWTLKQRSPR